MTVRFYPGRSTGAAAGANVLFCSCEGLQEVMKEAMPGRIHVVGRKNSGKTTLVCDLVRELTWRGCRVATVKHTHHRHELDTPGKDSFLHREAGAAVVGILSPRMTAMFVPSDREERGESRYELFDARFADCDLILVEGDLQTTAPRIEVWRAVTGDVPYAVADPAIRVVVTDDDLPGWLRSSGHADAIGRFCRADSPQDSARTADFPAVAHIWRRSGVKEIADHLQSGEWLTGLLR